MDKTITVGVSGLLFKLTKRWILNKRVPKRPAIYIIKREHDPNVGKYVIPGGHLEFSETYKCGLKRELKEETGHNAEFIRDLIPELTNNEHTSTSFTSLVTNLILPELNVHYLIVSKLCYLETSDDFEHNHDCSNVPELHLDAVGKWNSYEGYDLHLHLL